MTSFKEETFLCASLVRYKYWHLRQGFQADDKLPFRLHRHGLDTLRRPRPALLQLSCKWSVMLALVISHNSCIR
jgi:hypothetical protein